MSATDENGLCRGCGGHGKVMQGTRITSTSRMVPNMVRCPWCDGRDRVTSLIEAQAEATS